MVRLKRRLELERVMGRQAWTAQELAPKLGMSVMSTRRYLRIYYNSRRLDRKRFGVFWYYAVARFVELPDVSCKCPRCSGKMDVYKVRCGCIFHICSVSFAHSLFKYCERHKSIGGE